MAATIRPNPGVLAKNLLIPLVLLLLSGCGASSSESDESGEPAGNFNGAKVKLSSNAKSVNYNESTVLNWSTTEVDNCVASGDWSGNKSASGSEVSAQLTTDSLFILTCEGDNGDISFNLYVSVSAPPPPTIAISANPTNVSTNGTTTLSWSSANATSCTASGDWSSSKGTTGSQTTSTLTVDSSFNLSCSGAGGTVNESVNVTVFAPSTPIVNLTASPSNLAYNGSTTLSWSSNNTSSCTASGDWSGNKSTTGSQTISALTADSNFNLTCNGIGGSANDSVSITVAAPSAPSVNLSASLSNVAYNGSTTLSWTSSNTSSCTASGDWSGSKGTSGSQIISTLTADSTFSLTCSGPGGSSNDSVSITVAAPLPTISLLASPNSVAQNGSTTLNWNTTNATSCTASGDWSGAKGTTGSETTSALTINSQFILTCSGPGGTVNDTVNVTVVLSQIGTALLSWTPPTSNTDNSQLNDLAGYKIRYGTSTGSYSDTIIINNPGLTSYLVENLASSTWYFAMTSFNSNGIESSYSTEVSKTIN